MTAQSQTSAPNEVDAALAPLLVFLCICFAAVMSSRRAARVVAEKL